MIIEIVTALFLIQCANILSRLIGRRRDRAPLRFNTGSSSLKSRGFRMAPMTCHTWLLGLSLVWCAVVTGALVFMIFAY